MRILMLVPSAAARGPMTSIVRLLADALRALGHDVSTAHWGRHRQVESLQSKIVGRAGDVLRIRRRLALEPVDVLLVETSHEWRSLLRDIPLLAASRGRVRSIVLQFHGGRSDRLGVAGNYAFKLATRIALRLSDGVLVLSSEEERFLRHFWPRGRFFVVTNPFVPPEAVEARHSSGDGDARAVLMFAGRLLAEKGVYDVVRATAILRERVPCRLVIAGHGPEEAGVAGLAGQLGIADDVALLGYLTHDELTRTYAQADVFVFPSMYPEGFPTVLSEAMSAGLPIVTTQARGAADHLQEGVNVLFVPPGDPTAVAAAVERLLTDGPLRGTMSSANRRKIEDFAPGAVVGAYAHALEQIDARD